MYKGLVLCDFDGTITHKDSYLEFIKFCFGTTSFILAIIILSPYFFLWKLGLYRNDLLKQKVLSYFFKDISENKFELFCENFAKTVIPKILKKNGMQELENLKNQGLTVVIVSASFEDYLQPWCAVNSFELLATQVEKINGKITGKLKGNNCYGEEKVRRIKEVYNLSDYQTIYCFGDSKGDLPMLTLGNISKYKPFNH